MLPWWSMRGLDAVWRANGGQRPSKRPELRTQLTVSLWRSTPQLSFCPPLSLSLSNTHMHTLTLLRPRPHFHGPKIEASTWLTEKQKEASESRFSPKTNCLPLWRRKKKEARHHKEEVSPAILTLLPPLSSSNATESEGVSETKFEWSTQTSSHSWQSLFRKMFFLYWSSSKAAKIKSF